MKCLSLCAVVCLLFVVACGDDSSPTADSGATDSGATDSGATDSGADASLGDSAVDAGMADCRTTCEHGAMICPATFPDVPRCILLCMASTTPGLAECELAATDCASANACFGG